MLGSFKQHSSAIQSERLKNELKLRQLSWYEFVVQSERLKNELKLRQLSWLHCINSQFLQPVLSNAEAGHYLNIGSTIF